MEPLNLPLKMETNYNEIKMMEFTKDKEGSQSWSDFHINGLKSL